jgi:protocatechuate 3,4-dioxygenase beta subunit
MQRSRFGRPILTGATGIPATPTLHRWSDEGSAILTTDSEGRYRFKTIKPAAYLVGPNFIRPAHIHFQVSGRQDRLVTQMYFENDPYNDKDPFLNSAGGLKKLLITKLLDPTSEFERDSKMVIFDIVLFKG